MPQLGWAPSQRIFLFRQLTQVSRGRFARPVAKRPLFDVSDAMLVIYVLKQHEERRLLERREENHD